MLDESQVRISSTNGRAILDNSMQIAQKPIALSFFSGAMGLDIGIEQAGFKTLLACEIDKAARKTIQKNKPNLPLIGDIRDYSSEEIMEISGLKIGDEVDLIMGGPPCQAFSTAGKRLGLEDDRGNVFIKFLETVLEIKPKYIVLENVRGLLSAPLLHRPHSQRGEDFPPLASEEKPGGVLHYIVRMLENAGYNVSFNLYNSANFGVPQIRERVIIICSRNGKKVPYLKPTHSEHGEFGLKKWLTFKEAVKDIPDDDAEHIEFPEKRLKYFKLLKAGQYWKNLPEELQKEALGKSFYLGGGKTGFLRRISWDRPAPTLVTHPAMPATALAHPEKLRPLSIQEYMKIQQFPDDWIIEGKTLDKYRQLGNAVPVGLGKAVGDCIIREINEEEHPLIEGFKYSRYKNTSDIEFMKKFS
ncbi:modification methylase SinI [Chimaeribacter californicus]|uniref:Cytosine-specific methyltransferase n=1 Tax=Chimaeribacter californicus TaxID=2060067 RepID=A0A2N5EF46_9GAMM|nr:DNA cytosine methyltransferase [Chimaeribacter californicus]PLR41148.1 modification methylase SinI [Chimaeribacter californicus]